MVADGKRRQRCTGLPPVARLATADGWSDGCRIREPGYTRAGPLESDKRLGLPVIVPTGKVGESCSDKREAIGNDGRLGLLEELPGLSQKHGQGYRRRQQQGQRGEKPAIEIQIYWDSDV